MTSTTPTVARRLFDMLNMIRVCETAVQGRDFESFMEDELRLLAVERALEIISEASRHLPSGLKAEEAAIPWEKVAGFGNVARHGYDSLSPARTFQTVLADLPSLKAACGRLYEKAKTPTDPWPDAEG